jgi:hypothetical protein
VNPIPELKDLRPAGKTDAAGAFRLMTFEVGDGAPAGPYKVLVKWPLQTAADDRGGRAGTQGPDRLRGKYYNLGNTPLTATVEERSNALEPFNLMSK